MWRSQYFGVGQLAKNKYIFYIQKNIKIETTESYKDFSITRDYKILFDIAENKAPKKYLVILGIFRMGRWPTRR